MSEHRQAGVSTIGMTGRYVVQSRGNIFASDSPSARNGDTVAVEPSELLLSALGVCALGSVEKAAGELNLTVRHARAEVDSIRDAQDRTRFERVHIAVTVEGVTGEQAQQLIDHFTSGCVIYNTVRRGGPISVSVTAQP
ncbi:osmotically inducible protein OsmC [Burkholderia sp. WAC0059]|uniref:OsmC family protein n=1 Tax=Burkholderia sp. WAC0059 TaxID=2066022 RepID=UPI000C7EA059|nr:OsmC family protein [Burkholderia sp. WAC0059]PLZ00225.1 osmotically inducible protein OsmC [Burkholderia sp. WAC0059]